MRLAIEMMDEADLRLGEQVATGKMRVMEADASYKSQKDNTLSTEHAKKKGTFGNKGHGKVIKKAKELSRYTLHSGHMPYGVPHANVMTLTGV